MTILSKQMAGSYALITVGTFCMALGTNMVYQPMSMVTGGFSGIGIILRHFIPVPLWLVTVTLNLPLFALAAKRFGIAFVGKTIYATLCFSLALGLVPEIPAAHEDYLMAALLGGALNGTGLALVIGRGASTGGSDLLSTLLKGVFPAAGTANILAVLDGIIVAGGMIVFGIRIGLYSIVAVFVTSRVMDAILEGLKYAKMLYIISEKPEIIAGAVLEKLERGVTALEGKGMYSGNGKEVLMCAVSRKEAVTVLGLVKEMDPAAFVIVSDVREVMGEGFPSVDL